MNNINEETKRDFISTFYFEKEYISLEEYNKLATEGNEDIGVETDHENEENGRCYKKIYQDFTYEELQQYSYMKNLDLNLRILNNLRALNTENKSTKRLLRYWIAISAVNLFLVLLILFKLYGHIQIW